MEEASASSGRWEVLSRKMAEGGKPGWGNRQRPTERKDTIVRTKEPHAGHRSSVSATPGVSHSAHRWNKTPYRNSLRQEGLIPAQV